MLPVISLITICFGGGIGAFGRGAAMNSESQGNEMALGDKPEETIDRSPLTLNDLTQIADLLFCALDKEEEEGWKWIPTPRGGNFVAVCKIGLPKEDQDGARR
jgi:hypothetical protein